MVLTLYYLDRSPPVRSVDLVIHALGITAQYKPVSLQSKDHLTSEYLKLNPLHTVPTITEDDGFTIWESRAIMTYLVSKYGKDDSLYPKDLKKRAIVDQRLHYSNDVFYTLRMVSRPLVYSNVKPSAEHLAKVQECQENIEKLVGGNKFMAGDSLTVADYSYITLIDMLEVYSSTGNKFPATKAWVERCKSVMQDFDKVNRTGNDALVSLVKEKLATAQ